METMTMADSKKPIPRELVKESGTRELNVFISYAHEDYEIAKALSNMLNETFGRALPKIFLDSMSIPAGGDISENIKSGLKLADVLILVSTGMLRGNYSWGGFETGYFEACHAEKRSER